MTSVDGRKTQFHYDDSGNLKEIVWPDSQIRQFLYEDSHNTWALTGVVDENNVRTGVYAYDPDGRAKDTQAANGANHYSASWIAAPNWQVTETYDGSAGVILRDHAWSVPQSTVLTLPNGQITTIGATGILGIPRLTSQTQPAGAGCEASSTNIAYDANGNVAYRDDFNGHRTCYAYDTARNLETARVEGLSSSVDCAQAMGGGSLPAGARKISTTWHSKWKLPARVAEPGRITTYFYNGEDPLNSGTAASCPGTGVTLPSLPDGSPVALLCKKTEQATTDATGVLGTSAALDSGVVTRSWNYTYNQYGQVLTADGPRTDKTDKVQYVYWDQPSQFTGTDPNAKGYTTGDLVSVTDAVGNTTTFTYYDKHGNVLQSRDANGVTTDYAYDARQRLSSVTVAGQAPTQYDYWPTGLLKKLTFPDGSWLQYTYDDAHRLQTVQDSLSNKVTYTLDNAGNRIQEDYTDPNGVLRRQIARVPDPLGRIKTVTGRE